MRLLTGSELKEFICSSSVLQDYKEENIKECCYDLSFDSVVTDSPVPVNDDFVLLRAKEKLFMSNNIMCIICPNVTNIRLGRDFTQFNIWPGHTTAITIPVSHKAVNLHPFKENDHMANLLFFELDSYADSYEGKFQNEGIK